MTAREKQVRSALSKANHFRIERARVRRELALHQHRDGCRIAIRHVADPSPEMRNVRVVDILRWVRRIETFTAMKICARARVGEGRKLGDLTDRERAALCSELEVA